MKLTGLEFSMLSKYETNMRTALYSGYARNPGSEAIDMMQAAYNRVAKVNIKTNKGCGTCILHLLQDCGRIYFQDKEERLAAKHNRPAKGGEKPRIPRVRKDRDGDSGVRKKVPVKTKTSR